LGDTRTAVDNRRKHVVEHARTQSKGWDGPRRDSVNWGIHFFVAE
jgi:hypothetical protein